MSFAAIIRELIAAGVTGDALVTAIENIERASIPQKSSGARRTERWRAKQRASHVTSRDVTSVTETNIEVSKKDTIEVVREEKRSKEVLVEGRTRKGTRLPFDWPLSESDRQFGRDWGLSEPDIDRRLAEFRDYWSAVPGQRGVKVNWSATWRNRVRQVGKPPSTTPVSAEAPARGWKPGMPTDEELRRKYAPKARGISPEGPEIRNGECVRVCDETGQFGMAELGKILPGSNWNPSGGDDDGFVQSH